MENKNQNSDKKDCSHTIDKIFYGIVICMMILLCIFGALVLKFFPI
jgi:hypothetical protein